jgi:hypothetical protein
MNLGGAKDRPELGQVWENAKAKLEGKKRVHEVYKHIAALGVFKRAIFG